jgi:hypothetical protein
MDELLGAVSEQLALLDERHTIAVVGGSALIALGLVSRATRDVDVVAVLRGKELVSAEPLPASLLDAANIVARDFGLPSQWLNAGPAQLFDLGLPDGSSNAPSSAATDSRCRSCSPHGWIRSTSSCMPPSIRAPADTSPTCRRSRLARTS